LQRSGSTSFDGREATELLQRRKDDRKRGVEEVKRALLKNKKDQGSKKNPRKKLVSYSRGLSTKQFVDVSCAFLSIVHVKTGRVQFWGVKPYGGVGVRRMWANHCCGGGPTTFCSGLVVVFGSRTLNLLVLRGDIISSGWRGILNI